jgi:leucyl/phenylalanyl-tRNA--protein transferase
VLSTRLGSALAFHADHMPLLHADRPPAEGRRAALFRESTGAMLQRWALGLAWAVKPPQHKALPALTRLWLTDLMAPDYALPDPEADLHDGLTGIVHDLSVPTLIAASERGLYPFAHIGPLKWWSPAERALLFFNEFHISKRMRGYIRSGRYRVTFDRDFEAVIKACAAPRQGKLRVTWITPAIMRAYAAAFDAGIAHCFEVCNETGELVGGGYGLAIGGVFIIESQFSRDASASKVGFSTLNYHLLKWDFAFSDNKRMTPTVRDLGFRDVPRAEFLGLLTAAVKRPGKPGRWQIEADATTVAAWTPESSPVDINQA